MTEPPSFWLIAPFALVAGSHSLRSFRLRTQTGGLVGRWTLRLIVVAYVPAALSILNAETLTSLAPVIEWVRHYVLVLLVFAAIAGEFFLRQAVHAGAMRLGPAAETLNDPSALAKVCDALQAIHCHDLALVGLRRLAEMNYNPSATYSAIAALYGIQRRFFAAEAAARKAIDLDPENGMAYYYLSASLWEQGRVEEVEKHRAEAARLGVDLSQFVQRRINLRH